MNLKEFIIPLRQLPTVSTTATIEDAHIAMSERGLGYCYILGDNDTLIGIFTDGDFRRLMFDTSSISSIFYNYDVLKYCTLSPLSLDISSSTCSSDHVRSLFLENRIYDLPITANGTLVGSLNIRALLE